MVYHKRTPTNSILGQSVKISIVIAVLNSHEIVRRQILHFDKMNLPIDVEVIFVDDGSDKPIATIIPRNTIKNLIILETHNTGRWTQPAARNIGVKHASGEYVICTDLDHIITQPLLDYVRNSDADIIRFKREVAVLDDNGNFTNDTSMLLKWGFEESRLAKKGTKIPPHGNSYAFKRELYLKLGGVDERFVGTGRYPNREEAPLKRKLRPLVKDGSVVLIDDDRRPTNYMIPNGKFCGDKDYNPFGFFHKLSRKSNKEKRRRM